MSQYNYKQQERPSNVKAVLVAIACTVIIICVALVCVGAFMDDDSKKKNQVAPTETWSPTRVPDGGTRPTKGGTPKVTKTGTVKPTTKPTVKVTKTSTPKPITTTTKPSTPNPTVTTKPPIKTYANCDALRRDYPSGVPAGHPAYQKKMDRDKDGYACEVN